jgi:hypothetical protein
MLKLAATFSLQTCCCCYSGINIKFCLPQYRYESTPYYLNLIEGLLALLVAPVQHFEHVISHTEIGSPILHRLFNFFQLQQPKTPSLALYTNSGSYSTDSLLYIDSAKILKLYRHRGPVPTITIEQRSRREATETVDWEFFLASHL